MSLNHVIVWLDQAEAHVIHFNRDTSESEVIKTASNQHNKAGVEVSIQAADQSPYLNEVAAAIVEAAAVLIVGPGIEKMLLIKHLNAHHAGIADKVVGVESVDHPSDAQLLAYARTYFVKEGMR